jgi:hypothetical protein
MHEEMTNFHTRKASSLHIKDEPKMVESEFLSKENRKETAIGEKIDT